MAVPELTTVSAVTAFMGDSSVSSAVMTQVLAGAENMIARYCGRWDAAGNNWLTASRTQFLDGEYAEVECLDWTPVTAIASVTLVFASGSTQTLTLTDLICDGIEIADLSTSMPAIKGEVFIRTSPFTWFDTTATDTNNIRVMRPNFGGGRKRVKVAYTGGYWSVPADLKLAANMVSAAIYRAGATNPALISTTLGQFSETYRAQINGNGLVAQWLGDAISILQDHRKVGV